MMVILEKQGAGLNPLRRLHHAHVFRFCSVVLCPPPCACPKSSFYTALNRKLCHLVMKCKDTKRSTEIRKQSQMNTVACKSKLKLDSNIAER